MKKYIITSIRHADLGAVGDVVEIENINEILFNSKLELVEDKKVKVTEKEQENPFKKELIEEVGFSEKRAEKVIDVYKSKEDMLKERENLPFEKVEVDAIKAFYKREAPKRVSKKDKEE